MNEEITVKELRACKRVAERKISETIMGEIKELADFTDYPEDSFKVAVQIFEQGMQVVGQPLRYECKASIIGPEV